MSTPSHDTLTWTWTAPTGQQFSGTADYIVGVKAGWEAGVAHQTTLHFRSFARPSCKYSALCEGRR